MSQYATGFGIINSAILYHIKRNILGQIIWSLKDARKLTGVEDSLYLNMGVNNEGSL
jgi:hypothetical protein